MKNKHHQIFKWLPFLLLLFISMNSYAAIHAGKVVFTKGAVSLILVDEAAKILTRGQKINVGDKIRTAKKAKALLKLIDGTQLSLTGNSEIIIKEFSVKKNNEKAELKLLKGGMRTISGFINKKRANSFKLSTPVASIGIRGTDFTTYIKNEYCEEGSQKDQSNKESSEQSTNEHVNSSCSNKDKNDDSALYLYVKEGKINVSNDNVCLKMGQGDSGYFGKDISYKLNEPPAFLLKEFIPPDASKKDLDKISLSSKPFDATVANGDSGICKCDVE